MRVVELADLRRRVGERRELAEQGRSRRRAALCVARPGDLASQRLRRCRSSSARRSLPFRSDAPQSSHLAAGRRSSCSRARAARASRPFAFGARRASLPGRSVKLLMAASASRARPRARAPDRGCTQARRRSCPGSSAPGRLRGSACFPGRGRGRRRRKSSVASSRITCRRRRVDVLPGEVVPIDEARRRRRRHVVEPETRLAGALLDDEEPARIVRCALCRPSPPMAPRSKPMK